MNLLLLQFFYCIIYFRFQVGEARESARLTHITSIIAVCGFGLYRRWGRTGEY